MQQRDTPVASAQLWFDAGTLDEEPTEHGAAHFLEHLLFKGTPARGLGRAAADIEGAGGDLNAWTSWDETCLYATVHAAHLDEALDVLFDMARNSLLDPDEVERERQVVLEEIRTYDDDPDSVATDTLHTLLFGDHAYGRPILGSHRSVGALSRDTVHAFWKRHHHPGRALLAVVGPVDPVEIELSVQALIRGWAVGAPRTEPRRTPASIEAQVQRIDRAFGSVVAHLGFPSPGIGHPDQAVLDVLAAALGQGASSLLATALDLERGVASGTWAEQSSWLGGGALTLGFQAGGDLEQALQLTGRILADVHRSGVPARLVQRARDSVLADQLFASETVEEQASELAFYAARHGGPAAREHYRRHVAAVTPRQIRRVAREWVDPDRLQAVVVDRVLDERAIRAALAPPAAPRRVRRDDGPVVHTLPSGLRVAVLPDDSELAAVRVLAVGGQRAESARNAGLSRAWAWTLTRGAGHLDAVAFAERCDDLAAWIQGISGRSTQGVAASCPAGQIDDVLGLLTDVILDPRFDPDDLDNVREELLDDLPARVDRPTWLAAHTLWSALWPGHPFRLPRGGTEASLHHLGAGSLRHHHRRVLAADNLVVAVGGGVDVDRVLARLEVWDDALPARARPPRVEAPGTPPRSLGPRRAGLEQATIAFGVRGVEAGDPRRTSLAVVAALLDSQSGRLFLRLREERGLAYSVWASSETSVGGGLFSAGLSTVPDRATEASQALRHELRLVCEQGPGADEVERTRRMLGGLAAMRHQRVAARVADLALATRLGLPYGLDALQDRLATVTPDTIAAALRDLGLDRPLRVTVLPR